jgi:hypothetical protein
MKTLIGLFLSTLVTIFPLSADERIGGTLENVDLFIEDLVNEDQHNFGEKYSVINRNAVPVRVSIKLLNKENIEDHLIDDYKIIAPHKKTELGYILQKDPAKPANWKYEWQTVREKIEAK